jgi:CheY-like chemotaxis protein
MTKPFLIVVDDNSDMADFVRDVAEDLGFEVKICTSANEFQQAYSLKIPTGIVMDIVMPDMDGNELIKWLVDQGCIIPIVIMSGYGGKYLAAAEKLGKSQGATVTGTLTKPVRVDVLEPVLLKIIDTVN